MIKNLSLCIYDKKSICNIANAVVHKFVCTKQERK